MQVFDFAKLSVTSLSEIDAVFDEIGSKEIAPLPQMASDPIRAVIDRTISKIFHLPDLAPLRQLLAQGDTRDTTRARARGSSASSCQPDAVAFYGRFLRSGLI